jgi:hypothetical protein
VLKPMQADGELPKKLEEIAAGVWGRGGVDPFR